MKRFIHPLSVSFIVCAIATAHSKTMIYGSNSGDDVIRRKCVDCSEPAQIIIAPDTHIYTMAVDTVRRKIYWTQQEDEQTDLRLWKANLDGSSPVKLDVSVSLYGAEGMAVDSFGGHIYWQYGGVGVVYIEHC